MHNDASVQTGLLQSESRRVTIIEPVGWYDLFLVKSVFIRRQVTAYGRAIVLTFDIMAFQDWTNIIAADALPSGKDTASALAVNAWNDPPPPKKKSARLACFVSALGMANSSV